MNYEKEKIIEISRKHQGTMTDAQYLHMMYALEDMAEWKEKQMIEKACNAYCRICDTQECYNEGNCNWVEKFRKEIKKK